MCVEGEAHAVDIAFQSIQEMVSLCDDAKYEAVTRLRQSEEQAKKQEEEEEARRQKLEKHARCVRVAPAPAPAPTHHIADLNCH